jgi:uncharacterized protein GlcG (DUF336 family)
MRVLRLIGGRPYRSTEINQRSWTADGSRLDRSTESEKPSPLGAPNRPIPPPSLRIQLATALAVSLLLAVGCGGGGGNGGTSGGSSGSDFGCHGGCANQALSSAEVSQIVARAGSAASQLGTAATIAILDRVGNVLALYQMAGAAPTTTVNGAIGAAGGLEGAAVPATAAAISKAGTGAYLSSQGNAFSTRTASQIIQENFNPGDRNQPGGPLFGVQFSQLPCSDVTVPGFGPGPHPLPLGLSADPGGIPLYKGGDVVGGIGVEIDGVYTIDREISDVDESVEELVALAGSIGFEAPAQRVASRISAGGRNLRYSDASYQDVTRRLSETPPPVTGSFIKGPAGGVVFGTSASGVANTIRAGQPAAILVSSGGGYPGRPGASLGGAELKEIEVNAILDSSLTTAYRARAAIRQPLDSGARVSIWVVDHLGTPLGFTRSQDAPVFGIDVALQKARTAAFFSSGDAIAKLGGYGANLATFARNPAGIAFTSRSVGNLARPFFPDGINGNGPGPLSVPFPGAGGGSSWSPFNTGLQLDLVAGGLVAGIGSSGGANNCTDPGRFGRRIANGIQIFAGGVPLYRGNILIGAIGVSGDGIDQDDMIAYYGASRRGLNFIGRTDVGDATLGFNAPVEIRADNLALAVGQTRLRYVNCPEGPFVGESEQGVCD